LCNRAGQLAAAAGRWTVGASARVLARKAASAGALGLLWLPTAQAPAWRRREARAPRLPSREAAAVGGAGPRIVLAKASREAGSRARGWAGVKVR